MKWWAVLFVLAIGGAVLPLRAAQEVPLARRLEQVAGVKAEAAETFFTAVRKALGTSDRQAACRLVSFPLQQPDGVVQDAAGCEQRYDAIFTIAVRKAVGTQLFEELFVNADGVMVGNGELWFAAQCRDSSCAEPDLRITAIHGQAGVPLQPPSGKVLLACRAGGRFLRVSADGRGGAQFQMWSSSRADGAPQTSLRQDSSAAGPTSSCGSRAWTFNDGDTSYAVSDLGCSAYLAPPPMGAVGRVTQRKAGVETPQLWCFE